MQNLPSLYQEFIHLSRYSRWVPEEKRRETWEETVKRYFTFFEVHLKERTGYELKKSDRSELEKAILELKVMPSMRCLMTAGEALKRDEAAGYNCSFIAIDNPRSFDEILYILSCGTGVGFSVERQYVSQLPVIAESFYGTDSTIVVQDSRIGWAKALKELLGLLYQGQIPQIDTSKVRPAGAVLKTFGGRASGPQPLIELFNFCIRVFRSASGRKLQSIECHDIVCKIAEVIVVGGVRRSALISLSNLSDDRMRNAKSGQWWVENVQRALANNSACYTEKPDVAVFMDEWKSLYESRSGERGIFNLVAAKKSAEAGGRRDPLKVAGTNPCVPGDTRILTKDGYVEIAKTVGKEVEIWNGLEWSVVRPFSTGINDLMEITFSDGSNLKCTPYHKFVLDDGRTKSKIVKRKEKRVEAKDLKLNDRLFKYNMPAVKLSDAIDPTIDAYSQGFYSGDGCSDNTSSYLYETKYSCEPRLKGNFGKLESNRKRWVHGAMLPKTFVPLNSSLVYCLNWFAGLCDSDGTVTRDINSSGIQICSVDLEFLKDTKLMLSRLSVKAKIVDGREEGTYTIATGTYVCKKQYRILVGNADTAKLISLGLKTERLVFDKIKPQRDARRFITVVAVKNLDKKQETFCFTEPKNNTGTFEGIVTGQCAEILLRNRGFCNLSEVVVRADDTKESLLKKVELATILGTFQSTLTKFRYLTKDWEKNAEEERLLGVSLTGILDNEFLSTPSPELQTFLEELKDHAIKVNKKWATKLGIPQSVAITCVKPSGCQSLSNKIKTNLGVLSFEEILDLCKVKTTFADTWHPVNIDLSVFDENNESQKVTKLFINGEALVHEIEFEDGTTAKFTSNHKLLTKDRGYVRVDELKPEDDIVSF